MIFLPPDVEKCVIDLESMIPHLERDPRYSRFSETYKHLSQILRTSVKIILPDNGEVYRHNVAGGDVPTSDESESLLGFPAPVTSFVYRWTHHGQVDDGNKCLGVKRITIALDLKQFTEAHDPVLHNAFALYSLFYAETMRRWEISPICFTFTGPPSFRMIEEGQAILRTGQYGSHSWTWNGGGIDLLTRKVITDDDLRRNSMHMDSFSEIRSDITAVVQCLHSLRAGASLKEQTHKSASRRKKMQKRGVGGFTYHVLELPSGCVAPASQGGTHASPRFHIRRAHIRKLPSGALTFVRQCFVGDKSRGVVSKDYSMGRA